MYADHASPSPALRMVRLQTTTSAFHARVLAARLGADGILTELRGNLDGPYPVGETSVWVAEGDAEVARGLLLADQVESTFLEVEDASGCATAPLGGPACADGSAHESAVVPIPHRAWVRRALAGVGLLALGLGAVAAHAGL